MLKLKINKTILTFMIIFIIVFLPACSSSKDKEIDELKQQVEQLKKENQVSAITTDETSISKISSQEQLILDGINALKEELRNPESLQLHQVGIVNSTVSEFAAVDLSSQNGLGGMNRETYIFYRNEEEYAGTWNKKFNIGVFKYSSNYPWDLIDKIDVNKIEKLIQDK